jgi:hypothetical protein
MNAIRRALAAAVAIVMFCPAWAFAETTPTGAQVTPNDEFGGVGNADYFAWSFVNQRTPRVVQVKFRPTGGSAVTLNDRGRWFAGGMAEAGSLLSYYRISGGRTPTSDVHLYDMATQSEVAVPAGVNTAKVEVFPAVSGASMTFVRQGPGSATLWLVPDRATGDAVEIKTIDLHRAFFSNAPNLLGNWITYSICRQAGCEAYRYDIGLDAADTVPHATGTYAYAPSADLAGTVYFEQSGKYCGAHARLMTWDGSGQPSTAYRFNPGRDMNGTSVFDDGSHVTVFADIFGCRKVDQDIVKFTDP